MIKKFFACTSLGTVLFAGLVPLSFAANNDAHSAYTEKNSQNKAASSAMSGAASDEYEKAMQKMNQGMMKGMTSDPSESWARMMVEHHQGAIDMSQIVLKNTDDPTIKQMAEKTIKDQTADVAKLKAWLSKH
ncbi:MULTISPECIES: DUF305 domain-containing protein [Pseudomonas]|uniref:DUF305 domain-containing protein n=2 Tax=Pseudomonas TaxID=286 RepID=A0AA43DZI7_PSESX|nr:MULTISPECIES: DUF305 domain-containing protein [Pseudomonas]MDH4603745.1 DUF305 domain-containing protein [Pseudomonas syringae pv. papulans]MDH4625556.1 DUF305 domain-containing protein [Pseudomonas syringae pv. papulans]SOS30075.1 putative secreted protein [Pseudomonas cerasi]